MEAAEEAEEAGFDWPYTARTGVEPSTAARLISGKVDQSDQSFIDDDQIARQMSLTQ